MRCAWDLAFPEVFPGGFSVVLGNPPWDVVLPNTKDFVANYDPAVLEARNPPMRAAIELSVLARPGVAAAFEAYRQGFDRIKRIAGRLYRHQRAAPGGRHDIGQSRPVPAVRRAQLEAEQPRMARSAC